MAALVTLAAACGGGQVSVETQPPAPTETAAPSPQATPDNTPRPKHASFAPGEAISTDGQAGVVFVDPATGAADAWLLEGVPANYSVSLGASDGHLMLYRCQHPAGWASPTGCEPPNAWYLFDMRTGDRVRIDELGDYPTPMVIGPEGDELLATTPDGVVLVSAQQPDRSRRIDVPPGYQLFPQSAQWNRDGSDLIVPVFHRGTPVCGYGSGPNPHYACGVTPMLWETLLISRRSGSVIQLGDKRPSFAWSPDGSRFALARVSEQPEEPSDISVYSRDGILLWSQPRHAIFPSPRWSPDGSSIAIQVLSKPEPVAASMRLDVLDSATGTMRYRIVGAIACEGSPWMADSVRLVLPGAYGFEAGVVADPRGGTLRGLSRSPSPSPSEPVVAYVGGFDGYTTVLDAVNIDTGETRKVATFSSPVVATTLPGSPLFQERIAFVATEPGGHGGCAEAIDNVSPPTTHFEYPPFAD